MLLQRSLKNSLLVKFIILGAFPIVILGIFAIRSITIGMQDEITQKNQLLAKTLVRELEQFLDEPANLLIQIDHVLFKDQLIRDGQINEYLEAVIESFKLFEMILLIDRDGRIIHLAPYHEDLMAADMSGQDFFRMRKPGQKLYWSQAFVSPRTGQSTVTICLYHQQGMIVGYLNLAVIQSISSRIKIGTKGYAAIADSNGITLAHPNQQLVKERFNARVLDVFMRGQSEGPGTYRYRFAGEEKIGSIEMVRQTGWPVLITQSVAEAFAPVYRLIGMIVIGLVLSVLAALLFALYSMRKTLKPIFQLASSTERIIDGKYSFTPPRSSYCEIDDLAAKFEIMVQEIRVRENLLRQSKEQYRSLAENSQDCISRFDRQFRFLFQNAYGYRILGFPGHDFIGKTLRELGFEEETCRVWEEKMQQAFDTGKQVDHVFDWQGPDGLITLDKRIFPEYSPEGKISTVLCVSRDITSMKRIEHQLVNSLHEKEVLLQEVHHRVKNNMQVISSLLKLQAAKIEDPRINDIFLESQNRVFAMSAVHEALYQSDNFSRIALKPYLQKVIKSLFQTYSIDFGLVQLLIEIAPVELAIEVASPLGLVINELISNALKYAFPEAKKGNLAITLTENDGNVRLVIADDGIGFSDQDLWENPSTLGLSLVKTLVEDQLDGTIVLNQQKGAEFVIEFEDSNTSEQS